MPDRRGLWGGLFRVRPVRDALGAGRRVPHGGHGATPDCPCRDCRGCARRPETLIRRPSTGVRRQRRHMHPAADSARRTQTRARVTSCIDLRLLCVRGQRRGGVLGARRAVGPPVAPLQVTEAAVWSADKPEYTAVGPPVAPLQVTQAQLLIGGNAHSTLNRGLMPTLTEADSY